MKGIKKHTHKERAQVLMSLVPLIKQKFGKNLMAIATRGSFARKTDQPYSDLELFVFLKEMPRGQKKLPYAKMRKICDGLLVELIWIIKEVYIREVKEVSSAWFGSGADILMPVYNKTFADKLNQYKIVDLKKKCLDQAVLLWPSLLSTSTALINIVGKKEQDRIALAIQRMFDNVLNFLSFINQQPFTTYSQKIKEAKKFKIKPKSFLKLTKIIVEGEFKNYDEIKKCVTEILKELKCFLKQNGYELIENSSIKRYKSDSFGMENRNKRYEQVVLVWDKVQESTAKVLNAAETKNREGMVMVIGDMFFQYLKVLSCLNAKTLRFSQIIKDAKKLKYKPVGFLQLIRIIEKSEYKKLPEIKKIVTGIFSELENKIEKLDYKLYQDNFDLNKI